MFSGSTAPGSDKYEVLKPLGRGGMGEVYLARDLRLDRKVAIKCLRQDLATDEFRARMAKEAKLLAQLNHPYIVQIYDIIDEGEDFALVMEYVDGRNLHIHSRERQLEYSEVLCWLAEIAEGLAAAHAQGIAHCDLKAENVLINGGNTAKVTDFGIATHGESAEDSAADMAADVLALATLARRLFDGINDVSPTLNYLLEQMEQSKPRKRPSSRDAAEGLRRCWLESSQDDTAPPQAVVAASRSKKALWAATAVLLVVAVLTSAWWVQRPVQRDYVAVLPTVIKTTELSEQQQGYLRTTVQQALQQSVLATKQLALVNTRETAEVKGSIAEIAAAVGADEVLVSEMECGATSCQLHLQRLGGADFAVISQRSTSLLVEAPLASYTIVQNQWPQLYFGSTALEDVGQLISEEAYQEYLALYQASYIDGKNQKELFARVEGLLQNSRRFLPVYHLYAHVAMEMYTEYGDPEYLDQLDVVLENADLWVGDSLLLHQSRSRLALERGDFELAANEIEAIRRLGGDELQIDTLTALLYTESGEFAKAESFYLRALAFRPSRRLYWFAATNYYYWAKPDEVRAILERSLMLYPFDGSAIGLLGMVAMEQGELELAIEHFTKAADLDPNIIRMENLGLAYMLLGDYGKARAQFLHAYDEGSRDFSLLINLADTEALLGNREAAHRYYRDVISGMSRHGAGVKLGMLSQAYAQLGDYDTAIEILKRIESESAELSEKAFNAALVYALAGQNLAALVEVRMALSAGYGAIWFALPWFDSLCEEPSFAALMANGGIEDRCI